MKTSWLALLPLVYLVGCGEPERCGDNEDNDNDGLVDCDDAEDCSDAAACQPPAEDCNNGADDDGDGATDCDDSDCTNAVKCAVAEVCDNGADDDGDGDVDCNDTNCINAPNCLPPEVCGNLKDDDRDGLLDCADPDCNGNAVCNGNECTDNVDNDGDSLQDAADPGCQIKGSTSEDDAQCADGIDNDFDGAIDNDDDGCVNGVEVGPEGLPDLILLRNTNLVFEGPGGTPTFETRVVDENDPAFLDGCITGTGERKLLEWNAFVGNIGDRDLIVGFTDAHRPIWTDNPFFGLLFEGWTRVALRDENGTLFAQGHKGSFCMIDLFDIDPEDGNFGQFGNCGAGQGISQNFADVYSIGLECQYIDVTDVPPGSYLLEAETDFTKQLPEKSYDNNSFSIPVEIPEFTN